MLRPLCEIVILPKLAAAATDQQSISLAQKFREFTLHALRTSPEAFASSYEVASQRDLDHTIRRLSNPKAVHFIALDRSSSENVSQTEASFGALQTADWCGMIVLLGPEIGPYSSAVSAKSDPFARMTTPADTNPEPGSADQTVAATTLHYHLNGVFVSSGVRKGGLGRKLIDAALYQVQSEVMKLGKGWWCTILVDSENKAARGLYESAGFTVVGRETYVQQRRELVANDLQVAERVALHMELRASKSQGLLNE